MPWHSHLVMAQWLRGFEFRQKQQAVLVVLTGNHSPATEVPKLAIHRRDDSKLLKAAPQAVLSADDHNYVDIVKKHLLGRGRAEPRCQSSSAHWRGTNGSAVCAITCTLSSPHRKNIPRWLRHKHKAHTRARQHHGAQETLHASQNDMKWSGETLTVRHVSNESLFLLRVFLASGSTASRQK